MKFDSVAEGRSRLKELLDAAAGGFPAALRRDQDRFAVVDAARLRHALSLLTSPPQVVSEAGGWSVFFPGTPIGADGPTIEAAMGDAVDALREYAQDWIDRLSAAPNHADNWGLVQFIELSSDQELLDWLSGEWRGSHDLACSDPG